MANQFQNTSWVSLKVLGFLTNNLTVAEYFNRDWEKDFRREFAPGSTIDVKFPQSFLTIDGPGYAPQGINQQITTITLDQWVQIPFEWDDMEVALKLERSEEELDRMYFEPAGKQMAQEWDSRAALFATNNLSTIVANHQESFLHGGLDRKAVRELRDYGPHRTRRHVHRIPRAADHDAAGSRDQGA